MQWNTYGVRERFVLQMLVKRLFKTFWQAKEMRHLPKTNMLIMDAGRRCFHPLVLRHKGGFAEYRG